MYFFIHLQLINSYFNHMPSYLNSRLNSNFERNLCKVRPSMMFLLAAVIACCLDILHKPPFPLKTDQSNIFEQGTKIDCIMNSVIHTTVDFIFKCTYNLCSQIICQLSSFGGCRVYYADS